MNLGSAADCIFQTDFEMWSLKLNWSIEVWSDVDGANDNLVKEFYQLIQPLGGNQDPVI